MAPVGLLRRRLMYYRRVIAAYGSHKPSQLTFWHETPQINDRFDASRLGEYYMLFRQKADYPGPFDSNGIPLLNYHGSIGLQYNPIAIAQYGLANYNLYIHSSDPERRSKFIRTADWLVDNLETNAAGLRVWNHHFDWDYRTPLKAPWYSALAQGQAISLLVRAAVETNGDKYSEAALEALDAFFRTVDDGGVVFVDEKNDPWLEEYIVFPPTHILNGFIWASWGLYDYFLFCGDRRVKQRFDEVTATLGKNLARYDVGFWSLYELSGTRMHMVASPFYHALHVVQLETMYRLTGEAVFRQFSRKWDRYRRDRWRRGYALAYKAVFKLCYY
jgi:heparosan-N-sulfate-glucuronate 5-epimerase